MNKSIKTAVIGSLALWVVGSVSVAGTPKQYHDNKVPINDVAAQGKEDTTEAVNNGELTPDQGKDLNRKHQKIENAEQKNADLRHGLVSRGDHAKFNKKARRVNVQRTKTIQKNADEKAAEEAQNENRQ